ncbi:hypothetical protein BGX27_010793 [Mortierella sp. AM989]|nr:hypothetical protein BGX27_010793 [Mortierella sp. AM989]
MPFQGLPEVPSRQEVNEFYDDLLDMDTPEMNMLRIDSFPKWARRVLNEERCRRKEHGGAVVQPSKKVKKRIISLGAGPATSSNNRSSRKKRNQDPEQEVKEFDGFYLHKWLTAEAEYDLKYDKSLTQVKSVKYGERSIIGQFTCTKCRPNKRGGWKSGIISTELWLSTSDNRYRTQLNAQQCRGCESYAVPEVDVDNYTRKVISAFDLWKGLRYAEARTEYKRTAPHDTKRCYGCKKKVCSRWNDPEPAEILMSNRMLDDN